MIKIDLKFSLTTVAVAAISVALSAAGFVALARIGSKNVALIHWCG